MTTPVHADPRRSGAAAGHGFAGPASGDRSALDMPVLFQLSDLSQAKVLSPPARPKHQPAAKSSDTEPVAAVRTKTETADPLSGGEVSAAPEKDAATAVMAGEAESANSERPLLAAAVAAAESSAPAPPDSPTIRERAQLRERRRQAATQGDWFQTQGKYILVVFLVLLVGTIYVARRGDDDSPPSPTIDPTDLAAEAPASLSPLDEPQLEQPQLAAESHDTAPAESMADVLTVEPPASPLAESSPAEALTADDSPIAMVDQTFAAESAPQVTLQAPLQDEPQQPAADGSLFPWANQPEPRVATRPAPETQGSSVPLPQANPHFPARPYAHGSVAAAPQQPANASPEVYPFTGIEGVTVPEATMPADAATPAVYPVADPALPRSSSVQPPHSAAGTGTMPASYENRVPPAPRTSGPRYERTGSGLY
ncbi:MAG TPA: hypothetical protein VMP01_27275 [Pirellulaceae bacterium]|nr:hypothetical protein [Pirellulaceae bacterium]